MQSHLSTSKSVRICIEPDLTTPEKSEYGASIGTKNATLWLYRFGLE